MCLVFIFAVSRYFLTSTPTPLFMGNASADIVTSYIITRIVQNMEFEFSGTYSSDKIITGMNDQKCVYKNSNNVVYNNSANFEYQMFNVTIGMQQKKTFTLGKFIPPTDSHNILIVTRSRSGSSFLGDLLSRYPGTFYTYEPLSILDNSVPYANFHKISLNRKQKIDLIKNVFKCTPSKEYIRFTKSWNYGFDKNFRFKTACENVLERKEACFHPQVYNTACSLFPIRLVKTIRLPFEDAESFLLDPEIGQTLKIIYLFRDPRGRIQSLKYITEWCKDKDNLCNITSMCRDLELQTLAASELKKKYPG